MDTATQQLLQVEITIPVDQDFVDFLTKYNDIFKTDYIGYWARGIRLSEFTVLTASKLPVAWMVVEHEAFWELFNKHILDEVFNDGTWEHWDYDYSAIRSFNEIMVGLWNEKIPNHDIRKAILDCFHVLTPTTALEVIREGCKKYGVEFQQNWDANMVDFVVQMALLGEQRYS